MTDTQPPGYALATIYAAIKAAALAGQPAPSSRVLATLIGAKSHATASAMTDRLIAAGRIIVTSYGNSRVIACAQGEWRTADAPGPKPPATKKREFTAEEDAIIRAAHARKISVEQAIRELRTSPASFYRRMDEIGLQKMEYGKRDAIAGAKDTVEVPKKRDGWIPIAHGGCGRWREYEGTPIGIDAAQAAVAAGRATMAQRRIDGGFDLLFKVLR